MRSVLRAAALRECGSPAQRDTWARGCGQAQPGDSAQHERAGGRGHAWQRSRPETAGPQHACVECAGHTPQSPLARGAWMPGALAQLHSGKRRTLLTCPAAGDTSWARGRARLAQHAKAEEGDHGQHGDDAHLAKHVRQRAVGAPQPHRGRAHQQHVHLYAADAVLRGVRRGPSPRGPRAPAASARQWTRNKSSTRAGILT